MTVGELLDRMDSAELSEWMAFAQLEPLPDPWYQTGLMCSTMANLWSKARMRPDDFVPRVRSRRRQSPEEQVAIMRTVSAYQDARVGSRRAP